MCSILQCGSSFVKIRTLLKDGNLYVGLRGFYDVVFRSPEHRSALLAKVPVFFDKRLVHVMQWSPVVDYHALLKQECPVWVIVDCKHAFYGHFY